MWYKEAQQGVMNLDRIFQGAEQAITSWLQNQVVLVPSGPNEVYNKNGYYEFENMEIPPFLKKYISKVDHNVAQGTLGTYNPTTKTLSLPLRTPYSQYKNLLSIVLHEIRHSIDPRFNNEALLKKYHQQYTNPNAILKTINNILATNKTAPTYEDFITEFLKNIGLPTDTQQSRDKVKESFSESNFMAAIKAKVQNIDLYFNNPLEHSSQMGDIKALLSKKNLDKVREYLNKDEKKEYHNLSDLKFRLLLKNGLNPKNRNFEAFSEIVQYVTGNQASSLSTIVNNTKDPNWQKQYLKQVNDAVSVYDTDGNRFIGLVRKENRLKPDNPNAGKNLQAFFNKAAQIEALAEKNPGAWNKFINSNFAMRMISNKIYNIFKGIGSGSKSLSRSLKGLNMNNPLWAFFEPALEFGLYQFGLYLENPSAYNLDTPEQTRIKGLNTQITEILADNTITDKRGYFIKNYGSYLKTLGTVEQNQLLGKFPVMGFNQFQNIGRNTGQK